MSKFAELSLFIKKFFWLNSEQETLCNSLITENQLNWDLDSDDPSLQLKFIGGVDISFVKDSNEDACAGLVVLLYPTMEVIYEKCNMIKLTLPYIPGYLAFRECSFLLDLLEELYNTQPEIFPQVIMVDGNGILHPRGLGLASHLG